MQHRAFTLSLSRSFVQSTPSWKAWWRVIPILLGLLFSVAGAPLTAQPELRVLPFATGLNEPRDIAHAGDERLFVAERDGAIRILDARGNVLPQAFADLSPLVGSSGFEQGLLGLVFHPDYAVNGFVYVYYTDVGGDTRIDRITRDVLNPNRLDPATRVSIFSLSQPFTNHNAGDLNFGPDGYLYIALGDGGDAGDPLGSGQDSTSLLGKILRIDVDGPLPYAIPADNPFAGHPTVPGEIWAFGVRNPWRASFDRQTGDYWFADVGQDSREEINREPAGFAGGANYGWACREGSLSFNPTECAAGAVYTEPVFDYPHNFTTGGLSVTGGYVYRGRGHGTLFGQYLFGDFLSGNFWATDADDPLLPTQQLAFNLGGAVSFGENASGELFLARWSIDTIYRVAQACGSTSRPTGLNAQVIGPNSVDLYWDPIPGAQGYRITGRRAGSAGSQSLTTGSNTALVNVLQAATAYTWTVQARCQDGGIITLLSDTAAFSTPAARHARLAVERSGMAWRFHAEANGQWTLMDLSGRVLTRAAVKAGPISLPQQGQGPMLLVWQPEGRPARQALLMPW
jgi:glucose/arabinose dehydrogenase